MDDRRSQRRLRPVLAALVAGGDDVATAVEQQETTAVAKEASVALPAALLALLPDGVEDLVVRPAGVEDEKTLDRVTHYGFAAPGDPDGPGMSEMLGDDESRILTDATWGAFAGEMAVSQLLAHPWTMGGGNAGCGLAAVSGVGTLPEFRRLGLLRTMMSMLFKDMRQKGQAIAALGATQAAIYQRYGYAQAVCDVRTYSIDTVDVAFVDGDGGSCIVTRREINEELREIMRPLYDQFIEGRCCAVAFGGCEKHEWSSAHNRLFMEIPEAMAEMMGGRNSHFYTAVATNAVGEARGYCIYQTESGWSNGGGDHTPRHPTRDQKINVAQLVWADTDAYRSMLSFFARHDLVGEINLMELPSDDPAPTLLLEPRLLRTKVHEGSWWRIVDVIGALESRRYDSYSSLLSPQAAGVADTLTLAVSDDERLAPWNIGTFQLKVDSDGTATVNMVESKEEEVVVAEISVGISELALLWAGTKSARELHTWQLLTAQDEAALAKADLLFTTKRAPFCFNGW
jgi:predicted acetyltransferase